MGGEVSALPDHVNRVHSSFVSNHLGGYKSLPSTYTIAVQTRFTPKSYTTTLFFGNVVAIAQIKDDNVNAARVSWRAGCGSATTREGRCVQPDSL
ncbi:uncharacterized protein PHALS_09683 [Plasmopara halstedii]|uniref:Uncharacterized protein n=1 Tax=Plasmopara halstedii TaxID=4781 RepID=A0A0P1AFY3_PLAHL|nr:uncharacterized protein PHALS_09683 [Plasmopara halstedii]CEG39436.1 hypothetical protein PHALS_09683 [Plasmopara halstedii]|eukprot:XP_024575805.1 hypothetical protein PHALS_09683 [Plasmopara halstedii]